MTLGFLNFDEPARKRLEPLPTGTDLLEQPRILNRDGGQPHQRFRHAHMLAGKEARLSFVQ